jgi:cytochrome c
VTTKAWLAYVVPFLMASSGFSGAHAALDAGAAQELMTTQKCTKCHAPDRQRSGPSLARIAEKYRGKADGEKKVIDNFTKGATVKLVDGTEEEHPVLKTKDPAQLKNLAQWILAR